MAVALLGGIILLFLFSYKFIDHDFLSPINLYLLFSIVSIAAMFLYYSEWNMNEYGTFTTVVYLTGSAAYMMGCWIAKTASHRTLNRRARQYEIEFTDERIDVSLIKIAVIIGVCVIALYGTYSYIRSLGSFSVSSLLGFGQVIQNFRSMRTQGILIEENAKGFIWTLLSYLARAFAYYSIFIVMKNAVNKCFKKKDLLLLIPFLINSLECLLQSNRGGIIQIFFATIIAWFISAKFKEGWKKRINNKAVKIVLRIALIAIPVFFGSLVFLGRYDNLSNMDWKHYSLVYLSGGVRNLDLFLKDPTSAPQVFGEETFVTMHRYLYVKQGIGSNLVRYLEFRKINGVNIGNIYTSYRRFYHDFGFAGCLILPFIQGLILSLLYYNINRNTYRKKLNFIEVMYCYLSYTIIYIAIDDLFFSSYFSVTGIKLLVVMFAAYFFMFNLSMERGLLRIDLGRLRIGRR